MASAHAVQFLMCDEDVQTNVQPLCLFMFLVDCIRSSTHQVLKSSGEASNAICHCLVFITLHDLTVRISNNLRKLAGNLERLL